MRIEKGERGTVERGTENGGMVETKLFSALPKALALLNNGEAVVEIN